MSKLKLSSIVALCGLAATTLSLHSCMKIAKSLKYDLPMQTQSVEITIPASGSTANSVTFGPVTTSYNVDSFIKASTANQLTSANISSVKLKSCVLTLSNGNVDNNFANFQSVNALFSSNTNSNPYQISIPINPDVTAYTLTLPVDSTVELKSYLGNQFTYSLTGQLRRATTQELKCTAQFNFNVSVTGTAQQ